MKIPKRFELLGNTIDVEFSDTHFNENDEHGRASYRRNKIILQKPTESICLSDDVLNCVFIHEVIHHVLYIARNAVDDPELHSNESFVELVAQLLYQIIKTAEYEGE